MFTPVKVGVNFTQKNGYCQRVKYAWVQRTQRKFLEEAVWVLGFFINQDMKSS